MRYQAILFDLDGTLVDSIDLWGQAIIAMFKTIGIDVSPQAFTETYAPSAHLGIWLKKFGVDASRKEELRKVRDDCYIGLLKERVRWLPGAREMLAGLKGSAPLGMVTGSWMSYVDAIDTSLGVKAYFETIVTEDVMKPFSKPHPHGLLIAADRLGVDPRECIYVGDMEADLEAAHAAGMPCCIMRGKFTSKSAIEHAEHTVLTLDELPAFLAAE